MSTADSRGVTAGSELARLATALAGAGLAEPRREARLLLAHVLGVAPQGLFTHPEWMVPAGAAARVAELARRRMAREPLSRIVGEREFWSLPFRLSPATLDPRPDSETLVAAVLAELPARRAAWRLLDLGTGSGCLLLALLSELPNATGIGVDLSPDAAAAARDNAARLGLAGRAEFMVGDWGSAVTGRFDVILSNPPYIPDGEIDGLEPEVAQWDPRAALAGGIDGLDCLRALAPDLARLLTPLGFAAIELGAGQADDAEAILADAGLVPWRRCPDLAGIERCVLVRPPVNPLVHPLLHGARN